MLLVRWSFHGIVSTLVDNSSPSWSATILHHSIVSLLRNSSRWKWITNGWIERFDCTGKEWHQQSGWKFFFAQFAKDTFCYIEKDRIQSSRSTNSTTYWHLKNRRVDWQAYVVSDRTYKYCLSDSQICCPNFSKSWILKWHGFSLNELIRATGRSSIRWGLTQCSNRRTTLPAWNYFWSTFLSTSPHVQWILYSDEYEIYSNRRRTFPVPKRERRARASIFERPIWPFATWWTAKRAHWGNFSCPAEVHRIHHNRKRRHSTFDCDHEDHKRRESMRKEDQLVSRSGRTGRWKYTSRFSFCKLCINSLIW